ncbi:MAG: phosphatidate cytidylyltransferase [SAR202 cluster bacterium]|nr:phosphatidate cytidylyltransferase [SAR202 cluster bacterium]
MPKQQSVRRNLEVRTATAAVAIPVLILVIWAGLPWVTIVAALAAAVAAGEAGVMAARRGLAPSIPVAVVSAAGLVIAGHFAASGAPLYATVLPAALGGLALAAVAALFNGSASKPGSFLATSGAALYTGGLLLFVPLLRDTANGMEGLYLLFAGVFGTDILAYGVGRAFGRHKMAPSISPGKTWEGAAGGLAGGIGAMVAVSAAFGMDAAVWQVVLLGAVVAAVGEAGDLLESKLKRLAGVKDAGWLVPGHGGVLDRLDSILFNIPVLYCFMLWVAS